MSTLFNNPIADGLHRNSNALIGLGSGLLQGKNWSEGMALGGQRFADGSHNDGLAAAQRKQETVAENQRNQTAAFLRKMGEEELAVGIENNMIDGQTAYKLWHEKQNPGASGASYSNTPVFLTDDQGNQQAGQMYSGGGILVNGKLLPGVPEGWRVVARPDNLSVKDAGDTLQVFDPNSGTFTQGPTIQGAPSANMDVQLGPDGRSMAPAAGSPQGLELAGVRTKAAAAMSSLEAKNEIAVAAVDQAIEGVNWATAGTVGGFTSAVPGLPAHDLSKTLDTIKANIGFEELQTMRDNSPTGGALGQVTERELAFLQSTIANIEQSQSEQQLKANLEILRDFIAGSQERRRAAFQQQYGGGQQAPAQPAGGQTSTGVPWSIEP